MTNNIETGLVWKPRNGCAAVVAGDEDSAALRTVMMRVLSRFPEACAAVVLALEEM